MASPSQPWKWGHLGVSEAGSGVAIWQRKTDVVTKGLRPKTVHMLEPECGAFGMLS